MTGLSQSAVWSAVADIEDLLPGWDEKVAGWITEADALRSSLTYPEADAPPVIVLESLHEVRTATDRIETLVRRVAIVKSRSEQRVADAEHAYEDQWSTAARGEKMVGQRWDNAAPRERYAKYDLTAMEDKMAVREAQRLHRQIATAFDVLKMIHKGLESMRWSLDARLRLITVDTRLES